MRMNEDQAQELLEILKNIRDKFDVVIPKDARALKDIKYNIMFKDKMRAVLYTTLNDEQKTLFRNIEREIQLEV